MIAKTNDSMFGVSDPDRPDIADFVRDSKIGIDIWFEFVKPPSISKLMILIFVIW